MQVPQQKVLLAVKSLCVYKFANSSVRHPVKESEHKIHLATSFLISHTGPLHGMGFWMVNGHVDILSWTAS